MKILILLMAFFGFTLNAVMDWDKCEANLKVIKALKSKGVTSDSKIYSLLKSQLSKRELKQKRKELEIDSVNLAKKIKEIEDRINATIGLGLIGEANTARNCLSESIKLLNKLDTYVKEITPQGEKDPLTKFIPTWRAKVFLTTETINP